MSKIDDKPIVIVGGGPAGYKSALEIRKQFSEQKIILIEKYKLGGTCLHHGCIPSKQLHAIKNLEDYPKLLKKNKTLLERGIASSLKSAGVEFINAEAKVQLNGDEIQVEAGEQSIECSELVIATGSKPRSLSPEQLPRGATIVHSSDSFFSEENLSRGFADAYCFVGGGYIGIELASMLASLGKKVRVLELEDEILSFLDPSIKNKLLEELKRSKVQIETGVKDLNSIELAAGEELFVSIGREKIKPDLAENDHIHILGDAGEGIALAHYAYAQARQLAYKLAGKELKIDRSKVPLVIFSKPEVASIGLTSTEAKAQYGDVLEIESAWAANGKARISGQERGLTKWVVDAASNKILGCHIIGQGATDLISIAVPIINTASSIEDMQSWIYPHPTLGEIFSF